MKCFALTYKTILIVFLSILFFNACTPIIGPYSPKAYENATSLKPQTLALMNKAKEPYSIYKDRVEQHIIKLKEAHEFVKGIPSNSISARQWEILIKEDGMLFGKFVKRWEEKGIMNSMFIDEFKNIVSDAFDEIICLEANKKELSECLKN